jgi:hypothetical protein
MQGRVLPSHPLLVLYLGSTKDVDGDGSRAECFFAGARAPS